MDVNGGGARKRPPAVAARAKARQPRPAGGVEAHAGRADCVDDDEGGDGRRSRWTQHREQRRVELIGAAIEAVLAHGPEVDMAQVAEVAGVSKPVLYRYFADKYQLWTAVGEYVAQLVVDAVVPAVAQVREERGLIAATIDAYLGTIESYPDLYRVLVHQSGAQGVHHVIAASA
ncbi:MAG TPA: TetR/AcrR family transcriptional regulator, partial [Rugosimonospora sp.]|nr:TetR/AcrR family transcriptional regulator [Rugosimonospora sp.]